MLKTDNFFVQFEIDNVLFTETFRLAYRTEEYKKYWLDGILDKLPHYLKPVPFEQTLFAWMIERNTIAYRNVDNVYECIKHFTNTCLIDAAYEMLCWCIEKGYIKELENK